MRVPTTDYTPLRQANATKTQAERSKIIAPQMDNQRQSLLLNREAIKKKIGAVNTDLGFSMFQGAVNLGQLAVKAYDTVKSYQDSLAENEGKKLQRQWQTGVAGLIANNTLNISQSTDGKATFNAEGLQAVDDIQEAQMQHIDSQKWLPSVKKELKQRMQDFYSGREQSMLEAFYVKATEDGQLLDQAQMREAQDKDAAEWHYTDYRHFDEKVNSMKNLTENGKARLMMKGHEEIDFMRAANEVMDTATRKGQAAGVAKANEISDARDYNPDDRKKLEGYADGTAKRAKAKAEADGTAFIQSVIKNAQVNGTLPDFDTAWKQVDKNTEGMSDEQKEAYKAGMETAQIGFITDLKLAKTKGIDNLTIDQLKDGLDEVNGMDSVFEGTEATRAAGAKLKGEYTTRIKAFNETIDKMNEAVTKSAEAEYKTRDASVKNIKAEYKNKIEGEEDPAKLQEAEKEYMGRLLEQQEKNYEAPYSLSEKLKVNTEIVNGLTELKKDIIAKEDKGIQDAYDNLKAEINYTKEFVEQKLINENDLQAKIATFLQTNKEGAWSDAKKIDINTEILQLAGKADKKTKEEQDKTDKEIRDIYSGIAKQGMQDIYDRYKSNRIGSKKAQEEIISLLRATEITMGEQFNGLAFTYKELDDLNKTQNQFIAKLQDEKNIPGTVKDMIDERIKEFDKVVKEYFDTYPASPSDTGSIAEDIISNTKSMLFDVVRDADGETRPEDISRALDDIGVFFYKGLYTKLATTPELGMGDTPKSNAYKALREFEDYPQAYRYNEDKGHFIWLSQSMKKRFDDAAIQARIEAEKDYGIEFDLDKLIGYVKVRDRIFSSQARESGLVPLFYGKEKGESGEPELFIIQDGNLYRYDKGNMTATRYYSTKKGL